MKQRTRPSAEHISTERSLYGGLKITYLINGTHYSSYRYFGYNQAEAERLAYMEARQEAGSYFIEA